MSLVFICAPPSLLEMIVKTAPLLCSRYRHTYWRLRVAHDPLSLSDLKHSRHPQDLLMLSGVGGETCAVSFMAPSDWRWRWLNPRPRRGTSPSLLNAARAR